MVKIADERGTALEFDAKETDALAELESAKRKQEKKRVLTNMEKAKEFFEHETKVAGKKQLSFLPFNLVDENTKFKITSTLTEMKKDEAVNKVIEIETSGIYDEDYISIKKADLSYEDVMVIAANFASWMEAKRVNSIRNPR